MKGIEVLNMNKCILTACLLLFLPLLSFGFDCNHPDFGSTIQELNKDGYFIKYLEKGGVSYYNYTGPCRMEMHSVVNPAIAYGFIDDQLFARIIKTSSEEGDPEKVLNKLEERVSKQIGTSIMQKKQDGDWWIYQWVNEKDQLKFKIKIHSKTNERVTAFYYEPLREKLKNKPGSLDPVDQTE
jgi:hypothetical protein